MLRTGFLDANVRLQLAAIYFIAIVHVGQRTQIQLAGLSGFLSSS